jgi:hypothetical protein
MEEIVRIFGERMMNGQNDEWEASSENLHKVYYQKIGLRE